GLLPREKHVYSELFDFPKDTCETFTRYMFQLLISDRNAICAAILWRDLAGWVENIFTPFYENKLKPPNDFGRHKINSLRILSWFLSQRRKKKEWTRDHYHYFEIHERKEWASILL
ncbi:hypothetical protein ACJX0J_030431, partial [Zea mays]